MSEMIVSKLACVMYRADFKPYRCLLIVSSLQVSYRLMYRYGTEYKVLNKTYSSVHAAIFDGLQTRTRLHHWAKLVTVQVTESRRRSVTVLPWILGRPRCWDVVGVIVATATRTERRQHQIPSQRRSRQSTQITLSLSQSTVWTAHRLYQAEISHRRLLVHLHLYHRRLRAVLWWIISSWHHCSWHHHLLLVSTEALDFTVCCDTVSCVVWRVKSFLKWVSE